MPTFSLYLNKEYSFYFICSYFCEQMFSLFYFFMHCLQITKFFCNVKLIMGNFKNEFRILSSKYSNIISKFKAKSNYVKLPNFSKLSCLGSRHEHVVISSIFSSLVRPSLPPNTPPAPVSPERGPFGP